MKTISTLLQNYLNGNRSALSFNVATQYVGLPATLIKPSPVSYEAWIQLSSIPTDGNIGGSIYTDYSGDSTHGNFFSVNNTGNLRVRTVPSSANFDSVAALAIGKKHHVVATITASGIVTLYINGNLESQSAAVAWNPSIPSTVPNIGLWAVGSAFPFPGTVYEFRAYARVLTTGEVAEHFTGVYKNESGRVLWLPFWDGAGTTATDFSGYGNNGTLVNSPTWVTSDLFPADTRQIRTCDLLTITPVGSSAVYYTNFDSDIVYGGNTFLSGDVKFKRGRIKLITGVQVDNLDLELFGDSTNLIGGYGVISACRAGVLDGARVKLDRLYMPDWGVVTLGTVNLFNGLVGTISAGRAGAKIVVLSDLTILNIHMPRNVYQPGCLHTLFDAGCTLVKASFAVTGTVSAGATASGFNSGLTQADDYFTLGTIKFTSGANNALTRSVKSYKNASGAVVLMLPLPVAPANGDTFTIYPGCSKTQSICTTKFNNLTHFRGLPYVPLPETQT